MSRDISDEKEVLLTQYKELRQEIRNSLDLAKGRLTKGITAVGFVAAYAGHTEHYSLFLLVPVIVLSLLCTYFFSMYWAQKLSYQVAKIELELDTRGFDWERQVLLKGSEISTPRIEQVAHAGMYGFYGLIILILTVVCLLIPFQRTSEISLSGVTVGFGTTLGLYTLLLTFCSMTFYAFEKKRRETARKITKEQQEKVIDASKQYLREEGSATRDNFEDNVFPSYAQLYEFDESDDLWEIVSEAIATDEDFRSVKDRDGYRYHPSE
jgi:cell division protein FtsL